MSRTKSGGYMLTVEDVNDVAVRISELWTRYNSERRNALTLNEEARKFTYATDIDATSAADLPHKNRTHQPKLTQIADTLKSQYFEASLSMPDFFKFPPPRAVTNNIATGMEKWIRLKLEQRKFRETTGRQLINDYVDYGNCFVTVDYNIERDNRGNIRYKGPVWKRVSPMNIVFNPREEFNKGLKIEKRLFHVSVALIWMVMVALINTLNRTWQKFLSIEGMCLTLLVEKLNVIELSTLWIRYILLEMSLRKHHQDLMVYITQDGE